MRRNPGSTKNFAYMVAGSGLMAAAVVWFYDPQGLVTGGVTGLAIIIKHITEIFIPGGLPLGISTFALNIPIFLWAYRQRGRRFLLRTLFSTVCLSLWLSVLPAFPGQRQDYLLSAVVGGILTGVGVGMVLRAKSTTGGADLLAVLIQRYLPQKTVVELILALDAAVVALGFGVFGARPALYALIAVFITAKCSDRLTEGVKFAKAAFVITERQEQVAGVIMERLHRGVTALQAVGMYSEKPRGMLYCIVSPKELVRLKELVCEIDPAAFISVTDVREVLGEGFAAHESSHPPVKASAGKGDRESPDADRGEEEVEKE